MLDNGRKARAAWNETVPANMCHYEEARRRLVEGERLVAGWGELIARMQADGHDVTVARSLLKSFENSRIECENWRGLVLPCRGAGRLTQGSCPPRHRPALVCHRLWCSRSKSSAGRQSVCR